MVLRLTSSVKPYEALYDSVLGAIPAGNQVARGPIVLPLSSDTTPFILEGDVGDRVSIYNNDKFLFSVTLAAPTTQIFVKLERGKNFIFAKTLAESWLLLVVAANYATILRGYAEEFFYNVDVKFQDASNQLNSELSLRAVEHQVEFEDLLPPTRALRVLAGKIAVRSLINETGSTRGVDDIVTAASNTTPVVRETVVDDTYFEPSVLTLYDRAHDEGGFEFHVWIPNICVGTWAAFVKLMDNLQPSGIAQLTSVSDEKVSLTFLGTAESHLFDFETSSCSLIDLLTQDCLPIVVSTRLTVRSDIAFCAWRYPFDTVVELALGRLRLDSTSLFSTTLTAASISTDVTGSVTGVVGAGYGSLGSPAESITSATVILPFGEALIPAFRIPGTSLVVFPAGNPGRSVNVRYVGSISFDSGIPLDSREEADPLSDGWYGTPLVNRFDGGTCLDTMIPVATLLSDLECCFARPQATMLGASLATVNVSIPQIVRASVLTP